MVGIVYHCLVTDVWTCKSLMKAKNVVAIVRRCRVRVGLITNFAFGDSWARPGITTESLRD